MEIEIINIGSELMLGRVLNTHQQFLCGTLSNLGLVPTRQISVPDEGCAIQQAVRESLSRADLIITTGGLGPTSDDITRDLIAELLHRKLCLDQGVLSRIENYFSLRKRPMPESTKVQALVPEGAEVLMNANGTAPGLAMEVTSATGKKCLLVMLPGPPRELRPMFLDLAVPRIKSRFPQQTGFICRTLKTTGLGESFVEEQIAEKLKPLTEQKIELGYCARVGEVDVRIVARGADAEASVAAAEKIVCDALGAAVFGYDDDSLEAVIVRSLSKRKLTVALAESCTGGLIAHRLTNIPGASAVFINGLVTYSNESKQRMLGVQEKTLAQHGAVSEAVAREMAEGARQASGTDFALAVTGIAGPGGGSTNKPVGTVYIALATVAQTVVDHQIYQYDRDTFKFVTSQRALDLLRQEILRR